ncbi:hypothetical protein BKA04_000002 [Cryobacterium mesophilum]|uniref:DUF3137 domain-containing protein n=1 Tax=Terrimesophilobacter mesophilus TaxID=433647 RepID=A0A4R8V7E4_9MICO|nr:hypothetical protein [Terrimesophilobacter mesophilus]MBB5631779.1 hypothetical protein [Terrimesophilobacter mesophilus]TFB78699.1 hypothetical protein E3N84_00545 [Terrimesophilobacter mesophilus]
MTTLDFSALNASVTTQDIREHRAAGGPAPTSLIPTIIAAVVILVVGGLMVSFVMSAVSSVVTDSGPSPAILIVVAIAAAAVVALFFITRRALSIRLVRMSRFAAANGFAYSVNAGVPDYPGAIFGIGSARSIPERLSRATKPTVDVGDLRYTTGSGKNRKVHNWGYIAIRLDRMLPQMVLDATSNNFLGTNLPVTFSRDQKLSLEGDFDRYFTLYCPREYEADALYVFTPDLMARLVDEAATLDVEIVDDWMFLYSESPFDLAEPATLARIFRIVDTVGTRTLDRTERYADSRVGDSTPASSPLTARMSHNVVAGPGRRLQRGLPIAGVLLVAAIAVIWIANFAPLFSRL